MGRANNTPQGSLEQVAAVRVKAIVSDLLQLHRMGKPVTDDEVEDRINQYFELCQATSIRPGIESLSTALCIDRTTFWRWSQGQGCSKYRTDTINRAKGLVSAYLEQATLQGLINPVSSIFMLKNWAGYSDTYQIEQGLISKQPYASLTPEEIARKIEQDIPLD